MSKENRTSLRITEANRAKVGELREAWGFPSNDEVFNFLVGIADSQKMGEAARRHVTRLKVSKAKERQRQEQVKRAMSNLTPEQIERLIAGDLGA